MSTAYTDQVIVSDLPDIGELRLQANRRLLDLLRRLGILDGESDRPVPAFNSSI